MKMFVVHYRKEWEDNFFLNEYDILFANDADQAMQIYKESYSKDEFLVAVYEAKMVWKDPLTTLTELDEGTDGYDDDCERKQL
jgi:hypothetical protein